MRITNQLTEPQRFTLTLVSPEAARLTTDLSRATRSWMSRTLTEPERARCASTRHSGIVSPASAS